MPNRKLHGNRPGIYTHTHPIRMDQAMIRLLRVQAAKDDCTVAEKVRIYIEWGLEVDARK